MRAHQVMTRNVISISPETSLPEAAKIMLDRHISGLPVVDAAGALVGVVSEGDFLRRAEIGTQRKRSRWLQFFVSAGQSADEFVREQGRKVADIMSRNVVSASEDTSIDALVGLMEKHHVKRIPILRDGKLIGVVTRSNLLQAVAALEHDIPDPTADDDHIRDRILRTIDASPWRPIGFQVTVRNGVVHLRGLIIDDRARQAAVVAAETINGVKRVHDHLCLVDTWSGYYVESPEDRKAAS